MGENGPVRLERDGNVASIILDNPPLNLFGDEAWAALTSCLEEVEGSDARALVWRAEGEIFTGGVDVNAFKRRVDRGGQSEFGSLIVVAQRLERLDIPTLALVHGLCLTAGLEVALACDMIWATESARFGLVEAVVGLTPGAGGTQRMAERAGPARATEFVMSGGLYDAETLERWNVVNRVVPDGPVDDWLSRMREAQGPHLAEIERLFADLGRAAAPIRPGEVTGLDELRLFGAEVYGPHHPLAWPAAPRPAPAETPPQAHVLTMPLPGVRGDQVQLARSGPVVIVTVGPFRRSLPLPAHLHGRRATGARVADGWLEVEFAQP